MTGLSSKDKDQIIRHLMELLSAKDEEIEHYRSELLELRKDIGVVTYEIDEDGNEVAI